MWRSKPKARTVKVNILVAPHVRHRPQPAPVPVQDARQPYEQLGEQTNKQTSPEVPVAPHGPVPSAAWLEATWEEARDRPRMNVLINKQSRTAQVLPSLLVCGAWLTMAGAIATGGWLSFQFIINPGSVPGLQWMLPEWSRNPYVRSDQPQPFNLLRSEAAKAGLQLGEPISLAPATAVTDAEMVLIPVFARQANCAEVTIESLSPDCREMVEARVYRSLRPGDPEALLQWVHEVRVVGLKGYFVFAPVVRSALDSPGSSDFLPLTQIQPVQGISPHSGIWLHFFGSTTRRGQRVLYGQLVHFDSDQAQLELLTQWSSPAGELPTWQGDAENLRLVVNQTLGLEPQYKMYQRQAGTASQLEAITLTEPAIKTPTYENALALARSGLWSPSLQLLEGIKQQLQRSPSQWSDNAQAQLDLVALHANVTQAQAKRAWASPSQQIMVHLIDGQWEHALQLFRTAAQNGHDLKNLLTDESGRLWHRVQTALRVNPRRVDVQTWGALVLTTRQGRSTAIAWLRQQTPANARSQSDNQTAVAIDPRIQQVLDLLNPQPVIARTAATEHASRVLGTATPVASVTPTAWLTIDAQPLQLTPSQQWYVVRVAQFDDGRQWRRSPFPNLPTPTTAATLWDLLGLSLNPDLQLIQWSADHSSQVIQSTVRAVRRQGNTLELLVRGDRLPASSNTTLPLLAATPHVLNWLTMGNRSTLAELLQQQPHLETSLVPTLWQELQSIDPALPTQPVPELLSQYWGMIPVQSLDFTGNGQADLMLTIQPEQLQMFQLDITPVSTSANRFSRPKIVIVSAQGQLLYSQHRDAPGAQFIAIADLQDGGTPALIMGHAEQYTFQRWSTTRQQFE